MSTQQVILEIDYLKINRHRHNWNLYFVAATGDPSDSTKLAVTTIGGFDAKHPIKLRKGSGNQIHFQPEGDADGSGLILFQSAMPADYSVQMRLWLMQTHSFSRTLGTALSDIGQYISSNDGVQTLESNAGIPSKWLFAGKAANQGIGGIGKALSQISDRNMGFVNMDEHFDAAILKDGDRDYHNNFSTGFAEIGWTWKVFTPPVSTTPTT